MDRHHPRTARPRRFASAVPVVLCLLALLPGCTGVTGVPGAGGPTGGAAGAAPNGLRATSMNGRVTGTLPADCRERRASDGQPLPDPACTPGVVNDEVSQSNLSSTICRSGYSSSVRASESSTSSFKKQIMVSYHEPGSLSEYELDHLVSLELGGSNDAGNLWPERNDHPRGGALNSKDLVENALHRAVCGHQVTLAQAQSAIASDWTTALGRLGLPPAS